MGVWCGTDASENVGDWGQANNAIRSHAGAGGMVIRANSNNTTAQAMSPLTAFGHTLWTRSDAVNFESFKNGVSVGVLASASTSITNNNTSVCFVGSGFSTKRIAAVHAGASLTATQIVAFYQALSSYMTAVGA
jgi:hypothetical protein